MNLRIAHVTATFPPYRGGTGHVCYHNARELARRGHDVHVLTAALAGTTAYEVRDGFTIRRLRPLARIGNAPLLPALLPLLRGFDVIHLHYPFILGAELARLASKAYRAPLIVSFHNDLIGDGVRAGIFATYQRLSAYLTVRRASRLCVVSLDHYLSSRLCRALEAHQPGIVELPNGVDTTVFCPGGITDGVRARYGIPSDARLLLFVAALDRAHHFKGLERLLDTLPALPTDVWLLIVGDGDMRQAYQRQAIARRVVDRVIFAGAINHAATPPFFRSADLTVLPSSPPESFGLVLIESLACGTPVVAGNIAGVRAVVDHGRDGLLVNLDDPQALPLAIREILDDPPLRQVMGQRGRARVAARYNWDAIGARLEAVYLQTLEQTRPRLRLSVRGES